MDSHRHTLKQENRQVWSKGAGRQMDGQTTDGYIQSQTDRQTDRQTLRMKNRQTGRLKGRYADR